MKKIGILTFHRAQNYGAVLQCYALYSYIRSLGNDVEVIDYYPTVFREEYSQFPKSTFKKVSFKGKIHLIYNYIKNYGVSKKRTIIFEDFIDKNIKLSSKQFDEKTFHANDYDVIIWGSDQVWNPKLTGGVDSVFAGDFYKGNTRFVSYAASTMMDEDFFNNDENYKYYTGILSRFDNVSTREKQLAEYLNSFSLKEVIHVLDPVFLLNKDQWGVVSEMPEETNYLLVYTVPSSETISEFARTFAEKQGLNVIEISSHGNLIKNKEKGDIVSPSQFLGYFHNASFVITSSFHGTAFSIMFNKDFYVILKGNCYDGRTFNLLKELNLEKRAVRVGDNDLTIETVNYENAAYYLVNAEKKAKKYIECCIC